MSYFELRPKVNENLRLNVSGNSVAANGQNVTLYSATGSNDQIWFVQEVGGKNQKILSAINQAYGLNAVTSGTWNCCLQCVGGSDASTSFEFEYATDYEGCWRLKLIGQNRYLTCDGTTSGSNVSWKARTGGAEQVWRFYPTFVNGPQNYAYMTAKYSGYTLDIIRTAASNIKLRTLEQQSLAGAGIFGINGGFFDPGTKNILCIARCDGAYLGPNNPPFNGSHNRTCGNGVIYRTADGKLLFAEGQDALTEPSLAPINSLVGQGTWAQGGAGMYLGWSNWMPSAQLLFCKSLDDERQGRTGFVVDTVTGFAYLIVNNSVSMNYIQFRQAVMTCFNLTDGASPSSRYLGLFLDGGSSTMLRAKTPQNTIKNIGGRQVNEVITFRDAT